MEELETRTILSLLGEDGIGDDDTEDENIEPEDLEEPEEGSDE